MTKMGGEGLYKSDNISVYFYESRRYGSSRETEKVLECCENEATSHS